MFGRTEDDDRTRLLALRGVSDWARQIGRQHPTASIVAYGSLVRGDYSRGSDIDVFVAAPTQAEADSIACGALGGLPALQDPLWSCTDAETCSSAGKSRSFRGTQSPP
jgi:predicted nucleotidyltransferase